METAEIRDMSAEDIMVEIDDAREEMMRMRFQLTTGEMTDYTKLRVVRRKVARLLTILHERELAGEKESE
jgi:large subunit ribosomal protein L29